MNRHYVIDCGALTAHYWTPLTDDTAALKEFREVADRTFGIRKSITSEPVIINRETYRRSLGKNVTHRLSFCEDTYTYNAGWRTPDGQMWTMENAWGERCTCAEIGTPEKTCKVHEWEAERGIKFIQEDRA